VTAYVEQQLFALGDATRRAILERLVEGPLPVGQVAQGLPVSRPAISQHLRVLERAKLVTHRTSGTRHLYQLNAEALASLREYFDELWTQALAAFKKRVEQSSTKER
jgi:DNA-binding transcriptional ArsR family regulator